jgi:hypothetical protein
MQPEEAAAVSFVVCRYLFSRCLSERQIVLSIDGPSLGSGHPKQELPIDMPNTSSLFAWFENCLTSF